VGNKAMTFILEKAVDHGEHAAKKYQKLKLFAVRAAFAVVELLFLGSFQAMQAARAHPS
jgi:hypothetical protein